MAGQVASEQFVILCACDHFVRVFLLFGFQTLQRDQRGRECYLRIVGPQLDRFFYLGEGVQAMCGIVGIFAEPLFIGFDDVGRVK